MASDAPSCVITSAILFRLITSYQRGVPSAFFHFWCAHAENRKISKAQHHSTFAKRLDQLPAFVAAHGDAHLLALLPLITESFPQRRWSRVCREAAKKKDVAMLRWAIDQGYLLASDELIVRDLIRVYECGDFRALSVVEDDLVFLQSISPTFLTTRKLYHLLMDVALIEWLRTHVPQLQWRWHCVVKNAVVHGQLEVLRHAYACAPSTTWNLALLTMKSLPTPEYWACIRYLLHEHAEHRTGGNLSLILPNAPVELLQIVNGTQSLRYCVDAIAQKAVEETNMEVLHRFESIGLISTDKPVDISQARMNDVLLYLLERRLAIVTSATIVRAAEAKRWDIVRYIHDNFSVQCTTSIMDEAAKQGRMDQVVFLHERRTEGCSSKALEYAAQHDNLTLVRYLTEVAHAPGTTEAMDIAAANGQLEVVKYFLTRRSEGCTSDAVRKALESGHHEVVRLLFTHCRHVFDEGLLVPLLRYGHFEIWETVRGEYPEEAEASIPVAMAIASQTYELQTVRYIVHTLGHKDLIGLAHVAEISESCTWGFTWAAAVWHVAGPQCCTMATVRSMIDMGGVSQWAVQFVVDSCVELNAREQALQYARDIGRTWFARKLQQEWTPMPAHSIKLHPWLLDPRTPSWVIMRLCGETMYPTQRDDLCSHSTPYTWAVQAAYRRDCTVLAMVLEASKSEATASDPELSFDGARAAAVRIGHLLTLQWLLEHVDTPVEPTLLDEALFYHRYEVALWLATHCPEACTAVGPTRAKSWRYHDCGYDFSLRQWLESDEGEPVRPLLDMVSLRWESKA